MEREDDLLLSRREGVRPDVCRNQRGKNPKREVRAWGTGHYFSFMLGKHEVTLTEIYFFSDLKSVPRRTIGITSLPPASSCDSTTFRKHNTADTSRATDAH